jgi:hypothetical protein
VAFGPQLPQMNETFRPLLAALPLDLQRFILTTHVCAALKGHLLLHCANGESVPKVASLMETALFQVYKMAPVKLIQGKSIASDLSNLVLRSNTLPKALIVRNAQRLSEAASGALVTALRDRRVILGPKAPLPNGSWQPSEGVYSIPDDFMLVLICSVPQDTPYFGLTAQLVC